MKLKFIVITLISSIVLFGCTVTLITGYDETIDDTATKIKRDFNLHFIKLSRTIQDTDPSNQRFENFQDYYDNLEVDLLTLKDRAESLDKKGAIVKKQVHVMDSTILVFVRLHKAGLPDRLGDDRRDIRNGINSSINAVIKLQEELKTTGKNKSK